MKKFHVTRKTVLTIVGVTLPLTAAAILLPRLKRSRRARSVRAYCPDFPTHHEINAEMPV